MQRIIILLTLILILSGCSGGDNSPVVPETPTEDLTVSSQVNDPHMLWGEWDLYFSDDHNSVDVVPKRQGRFHLNTLKFLEEYCADCFQITNLQNNGDSMIDLTVQITHPFPGFPQYTGFDVKGIIMFNGSLELPWYSDIIYPWYEPMIINWSELGDAEVMNPDGFSTRWSPWWPTESELPMFSYYHGNYSSGNPTSKLNAFLNFYTDEERHMFRVNGAVERTYKIYLPPGPVAAGYAIDACWEPPDVMPAY